MIARAGTSSSRCGRRGRGGGCRRGSGFSRPSLLYERCRAYLCNWMSSRLARNNRTEHGWRWQRRFNTESRIFRVLAALDLAAVACQRSPPSSVNCQISLRPANCCCARARAEIFCICALRAIARARVTGSRWILYIFSFVIYHICGSLFFLFLLQIVFSIKVLNI